MMVDCEQTSKTDKLRQSQFREGGRAHPQTFDDVGVVE